MRMIVLFFFKQKTAYEMRISDWSSDVCSSDLGAHLPPVRRQTHNVGDGARLVRIGEQDRAAEHPRRPWQQAHDRLADYRLAGPGFADQRHRAAAADLERHAVDRHPAAFRQVKPDPEIVEAQQRRDALVHSLPTRPFRRGPATPPPVARGDSPSGRSEEHPSEPQSLMRISYPCL